MYDEVAFDSISRKKQLLLMVTNDMEYFSLSLYSVRRKKGTLQNISFRVPRVSGDLEFLREGKKHSLS